MEVVGHSRRWAAGVEDNHFRCEQVIKATGNEGMKCLLDVIKSIEPPSPPDGCICRERSEHYVQSIYGDSVEVTRRLVFRGVYGGR